MASHSAAPRGMNAKQNASDQQAILGKRGPKGRKKKTRGGENRALWKGPVRGHAKSPLPTQKGLGRHASVGPWPHTQQKMPTKSLKKGRPIMPQPENGPSLGSHSSEGWVKLPSGLVRPPPVFLEKVWPQNEKKEKKKNKNKRNTRRPLPPRVPRKGPQKLQGESQKTPGAQNGTPEKRQESGRTAKTGGTNKNGGTQKERTRKTSACAGVSCYYLNFVS